MVLGSEPAPRPIHENPTPHARPCQSKHVALCGVPRCVILPLAMPLHPSQTATVRVEQLSSSANVASAAVVFCARRDPVVLESSQSSEPYARFSVFACDPVEVISATRTDRDSPFHILARRIRRRPAMPSPAAGLPFSGGWIGFLSYEAGLRIEGINPHDEDAGVPLLRFALYDAAALFDHHTHQWHLVAVEWPSGHLPDRPSTSSRLASLRRLLQSAEELDDSKNVCAETNQSVRGEPSRARKEAVFTRAPGHFLTGAARQEAFPTRSNTTASDKANHGFSSDTPETFATPNMTVDEYTSKVRQAKRYIQRGDIYQVNLSQRFATRTSLTPVELFARLRQTNPATHGALLIWDDMAIVSASPELFLSLRGQHVVTRPIKGTRPRGTDADEDSANRAALRASEKDRAELNMIVDLMRNDLGRVCAYGSVRVVNAGALETHPTVFHRVATILGTLRDGCDWLDLLLATCPGGSITGAPKIRAMKIIRELERTPRGIYCGSIGMIGLDGSLTLSIAIRTMFQRRGVVHIHAGGAIVADSDPQSEYEEIMAKAAGMMRALGCTLPSSEPSVQEVPA